LLRSHGLAEMFGNLPVKQSDRILVRQLQHPLDAVVAVERWGKQSCIGEVAQRRL